MSFRNALITILFCSLFATMARSQNSSATESEEEKAVAATSATDARHLKIYFTGRLLGYYRVPEWQSADFAGPCARGDSASAPAQKFLSLDRPAADLLVGMGDNFGVTLEARAWRVAGDAKDPKARWQIQAKSRNPDPATWNAAKPGEIGDNVGCFLSQAGYDAIVPGKEDFYFGPDRLRRIAKALARDGNGLHAVQMLGANLVLKTGYLDKPPVIVDADKDLHFVPGMPTGVKSVDVSDNDTILPFMRQFRFEISVASSLFAADPDSKDPAKLRFKPLLCTLDGKSAGQQATAMGLDSLRPSPDTCTPLTPAQDNSKDKKDKAESGSKEKPKKVVANFNLPDSWPPEKLPAMYGLCSKIEPPERENKAAPVKKGMSYYCLRFTVVEPLFGDARSEPYFLKKPASAGGDYAVVFGIVDHELPAVVGRDNVAWRNVQAQAETGQAVKATPVKVGKETYSTVVDAMDEATTLGIAVRRFDLDWHDAKWRAARGIPKDAREPIRVLLAQMSRGKAENLASNLALAKVSTTHLRFDVVIAASAPFSAATADERVIFHRPGVVSATDGDDDAAADQSAAELPEFRHIVVVPWQGYDLDNHRLPNPLRTLALDDFDCHSPCQKRRFEIGGNFEETFPSSEVKKPDLQKDYEGMGLKYLTEKGYWPPKNATVAAAQSAGIAAAEKPQLPPPTLENGFEVAVLAVMRDRTKADVAMLQKRDFYWGRFPAPMNGVYNSKVANGELLERILWMGDYMEVLSVKGSTLKKVLDDSDKLDALDAQATYESSETARGLLALGIEKTRDKQYLVGGMQLDESRLYTVATSNHIAAGDNGYPELADPQFADTRLPGVDKNDKDADDKTPRISSLVCQELRGENCVTNLGLLFASIQELPSQLEPSNLAFVKAYIRSLRGEPQLLQDGYNLANYQAQLIPTWRFSLKDLSFNLSSVRNNLSEPQRITELGGVTEPGAGNAKSHTIDFSTHAEWIRSGQWVDEFVRGLSEFTETVTGNTTTVPITSSTGTVSNALYLAPALISRSKNQFAMDGGFFWHGLRKGHKYFDKLGFVLEPAHFDTQLAPQELQFPAVYDTSGNITVPPINVPIARNRNFLVRLALRAESDKSHFEIGYQGGWQLNGIESLTDNIGSCAALIITTCLAGHEAQAGFSAASIQQIRSTRERHGPYADLDWSWPLIWKLSFRTQESFQYFGPAHNDNAIDTLYRNDVTETLNWQLLPNLAIGPSLERFDYENKIEHVHLRTWSPSFKLTYSFDLREGGNLKKSLLYSPSAPGGQ